MGGESLVEIDIELPGRIVRDVEELDGLGRCPGGEREGQDGEKYGFKIHKRKHFRVRRRFGNG
jgi:hypothetical protein